MPRANHRLALILAMALAAIVAVFSASAFGDPQSYFAFADQRRLLGIAHFMDVMSNVPWAIVGIAGLRFVIRTRRGPFTQDWERASCAVLFASVAGVSLGSAYFHLAPNVETLFWDRLPMAVAFMSLFALVIGDRIGLGAGRRLFLPLLALGLASLLWWRHTAAMGAPDLRLYVLVQFFPMAAIPAMLLLFPGRYTRAWQLWSALGCYALAKLFELADAPIFAMTRLVSGHTLKHLAAAAATLFLLSLIERRREIAHGSIPERSPLRSTR